MAAYVDGYLTEEVAAEAIETAKLYFFDTGVVRPLRRLPPVHEPGNSCVQAGVVIGHTRMVPGCIFANWAGDMTRLARAVIWPGLQALPFSLSLSASLEVLPGPGPQPS